MLLLLVWLAFLTEIGSYVALWRLHGERPSHAGQAERLTSVAATQTRGLGGEGEEDREWTARARERFQNLSVRHPYLAYVREPVEADTPDVTMLSSMAMGDPDALVYDEEPFIVGLTGGSVAAGIKNAAGDLIVDRLAASPLLAGKRVHLMTWAKAGGKQPEQMLGLAFLMSAGVRFDAVINLDGLNDVALTPDEILRDGLFPTYPRVWPIRMFLTETGLVLRGQLAGIEDRRAVEARALLASPLRRSWLRQLLWTLGDRRAERARSDLLAAIERRLGEDAGPAHGFERFGPRVAGKRWDAYGELAAIWERSSREMAALCAAAGAVYVHALQPNQYDPEFTKPMSPEERGLAIDESSGVGAHAAVGYPLLREAAARLSEDGVEVVDLKDLFADVEAQRFVDSCCHFNKAGSRAIAQVLVEALLARLD